MIKIFKNIPSLKQSLIQASNESALYNRKTKNLVDIENDYWIYTLPKFIYDFKEKSINYNFNTDNNNLNIDLEYSKLDLNIQVLSKLFTHKNLDKLNINFLQENLSNLINFSNVNSGTPIKKLNIEVNNKSWNDLKIQFKEFTNFKDNKFILKNEVISTGTFVLQFEKNKGYFFKNREEFINNFLKDIFGKPDNLYIKKGDKLKILIYNFELNSEVYSFLVKDLVDNGNTDYRGVIKDITGGKYQWMINDLNSHKEFFFYFNTNSIGFTLERVK